MVSTSATTRRKPQQRRAAERRAQLLAAGAEVFAEHGYEATTMTAIAQRAQASFGALYDYFPDKQSLALALLESYASELDPFWAARIGESDARTAKALSDVFVDGILTFVDERPAYLALQSAPVVYRRVPSMRRHVRECFATAIQRLRPELPKERALLAANVTVELIKALIATYKDESLKERKQLSNEFRRLLTLYLENV